MNNRNKPIVKVFGTKLSVRMMKYKEKDKQQYDY